MCFCDLKNSDFKFVLRVHSTQKQQPRSRRSLCVIYHVNNDTHFHVIFQVEKTGETPEKEQIELKEGEEKKDETTEKGKKKKEKKEKKKKEPKEKKPKGPNCVETLSAGLNLADRDGKSINTDVCVSKNTLLSLLASFRMILTP